MKDYSPNGIPLCDVCGEKCNQLQLTQLWIDGQLIEACPRCHANINRRTFNDVPALHLIEVRFMGPTNHRGSRVRLTSPRFEQSVTISYDYSKREAAEMAYDWLIEHGHIVVGLAETKAGYAILTETFKGLKD